MQRSPRRSIGLQVPVFLCIVGLGSAGCGDDITGSNQVEVDEPFELGAALTTQSAFRLEGVNGTISLLGVSGSDSIVITGTRTVGGTSASDAEAHLDDLDVELEASANEIVVRTIQPQSAGGRLYRVDYEVRVPADLTVGILNANGAIDVKSLKNALSIENANGDIQLTDLVAAVFVALGNGEVAGEVSLPAAGTCDIAVGNGAIDLALPATTSADFSAAVGNGQITLINLPLQNQVTTPTTVAGRLGGGDGEISLAVGNGTITVMGI
ncbi:MAG: DUF4097 family beta strand repeat protein [Gemmatimonadota bacterium]|nr:MAG: DUF4097 family beta strand repeat protein [Gemmatimonadota bacterium]